MCHRCLEQRYILKLIIQLDFFHSLSKPSPSGPASRRAAYSRSFDGHICYVFRNRASTHTGFVWAIACRTAFITAISLEEPCALITGGDPGERRAADLVLIEQLAEIVHPLLQAK